MKRVPNARRTDLDFLADEGKYATMSWVAGSWQLETM